VAGYLPPSHVKQHRGVPRQPKTTSVSLTTTSAKEVPHGTRIWQPAFKAGARDSLAKVIKPQPKRPRQQQEHGTVCAALHCILIPAIPTFQITCIESRC
jgi:hypothetical protein